MDQAGRPDCAVRVKKKLGRKIKSDPPPQAVIEKDGTLDELRRSRLWLSPPALSQVFSAEKDRYSRQAA